MVKRIIMKLFIFLILLFYSNNTYNNIVITNLNKQFDKNKNLEFTIFNNCNEKNYYIVSVYYYKDKWIEMINDINKPKSKSSTILTIDPNEKIRISIPVKKIFFNQNQLIFEKYKLKIIYGKSFKNLNKIHFSKSFIIN